MFICTHIFLYFVGNYELRIDAEKINLSIVSLLFIDKRVLLHKLLDLSIHWLSMYAPLLLEDLLLLFWLNSWKIRTYILLFTEVIRRKVRKLIMFEGHLAHLSFQELGVRLRQIN